MRWSLPLPWEIITVDVSQGDNVGARGSGRGGEWVIKNARCRKRVVGSVVIQWSGSWMEYVWGRVGLGSLSYGPALAKQPAIPFSVDFRDIAPIHRGRSHMLCPISNKLSQPSI